MTSEPAEKLTVLHHHAGVDDGTEPLDRIAPHEPDLQARVVRRAFDDATVQAVQPGDLVCAVLGRCRDDGTDIVEQLGGREFVVVEEEHPVVLGGVEDLPVHPSLVDEPPAGVDELGCLVDDAATK